MGIFSNMMQKIFRTTAKAERPFDAAPPRTESAPGTPGMMPTSTGGAATTATATTSPANITPHDRDPGTAAATLRPKGQSRPSG